MRRRGFVLSYTHMITKDQFIASMLHETSVIKHLFTKIPDTAFDYKPTEGQRSTLELLQYLAFVGTTAIDFFNGNASAFENFDAKKQTVTRENFLETFTAEEMKIKELLDAMTEEQLMEEATAFGMTSPRAIHLFNILKWLVAYKMQLFLYIKANGVTDIGTPNLWGGKDAN